MLCLLLRRYCFFLFEACYVKHVCDTVHMSNWGRVYYTNLLSGLALLAVFPLCKTEHKLLQETHFSHAQLFLLCLSCVVGVCMSHAGGCASMSKQRQL
jgi:GDP-mannose transporter